MSFRNDNNLVNDPLVRSAAQAVLDEIVDLKYKCLRLRGGNDRLVQENKLLSRRLRVLRRAVAAVLDPPPLQVEHPVFPPTAAETRLAKVYMMTGSADEKAQ